MADDRVGLHASNASRERTDEPRLSAKGIEADSVVRGLEHELHQLDRDLESLRKRIWQTRNGMIPCEDPETEVVRLQAEFDARGDEFTRIYQAWSLANEQD